MKFKDKVVLITGASRGIGMATALHFGKEGANVVVNYLNSEEKANKVVDNIKKLGGNAISFRCDVSKEDEVRNMVNKTIETFGRIDILINNAAISNNKHIFELTSEQWKRTFDVNLLGVFLCSKYSILEMKKLRSGKVVNLSSISGTKQFHLDSADYGISKSGIISLTKILAKSSGPYISVNSIAPGVIDDDFDYNLNQLDIDNFDDDLNQIYLRRYGKTIEIVKVIMFLSGDDSGYINGINIFIDGGSD